MKMNIDIDKIERPTIVSIIFFIFTLFLPGVLFIYIFLQKTFLDLDFFKLILLACTITFPFMIFNLILSLFAIPASPEIKERDLEFSLIIGCLVTNLIFFTTILIGYFIKINCKISIIILISLHLIIAIIMILTTIPSDKKKPDNLKKT
jgi:hypothetical protein